MSGFLRRIRLRRAADEREPSATADEIATRETGEPGLDPALPAGAEPDLLGERPRSARRGRARRRLRHVSRVREVYLRDLGGFVYELHRRGGGQDDRHAAVMVAKLERLDSLDSEREELRQNLGDGPAALELREPGIGGACPTCGEIHGSRDRFCSHCGLPLTAGAARPVAGLDPGEAAALPAGAPDPMEAVKAHVAAAQAAEPLGDPATPDAGAEAVTEVLPRPEPQADPDPAEAWLPEEENR